MSFLDFVTSASNKILSSLYHLSSNIIIIVTLHVLDFFLFSLNVLTPSFAVNRNVPKPFSPERPPELTEHPFIYMLCYLARLFGPDHLPEWLKCWSTWEGLGNDGKWRPVNVHEAKTGSRGPCPGLNALANHGIINKSGRELSFHQIASAMSRTYNVSPFFAIRATIGLAPLFEGRKGINLSDLSVHNMVEHDASLLRHDIDSSKDKTFKEIQAYPDPDLIDRFFPPGKTPFTTLDCSKALTIRREECAANNPTFYRSPKFDAIGSENCAILLAITGGDRDVIRKLTGIKGFECLDSDWRPAGREAFGLNLAKAELLMGLIELRTGSSYHSKARNV